MGIITRQSYVVLHERKPRGRDKTNTKFYTILAILTIVIVAFILDPKNSQVDEQETEPESESKPLRPTINSWLLYEKWNFEEKRISGSTEEIPVPKDALACKIVVFWEGTRPIGKGYGSLLIKPQKIIDAGEHNKLVNLRTEEVDVNKTLLDKPDSTEVIVYVEEDALYYYFTLVKANIGDCIIEVYFGY